MSEISFDLTTACDAACPETHSHTFSSADQTKLSEPRLCRSNPVDSESERYYAEPRSLRTRHRHYHTHRLKTPANDANKRRY